MDWYIIGEAVGGWDTENYVLFVLEGNEYVSRSVAILKSEIKGLLEKAYRALGINYKAKATDLNKWYNLRETTKRGKDGKPKASFVIVFPKSKSVGRKRHLGLHPLYPLYTQPRKLAFYLQLL